MGCSKMKLIELCENSKDISTLWGTIMKLMEIGAV